MHDMLAITEYRGEIFKPGIYLLSPMYPVVYATHYCKSTEEWFEFFFKDNDPVANRFADIITIPGFNETLYQAYRMAVKDEFAESGKHSHGIYLHNLTTGSAHVFGHSGIKGAMGKYDTAQYEFKPDVTYINGVPFQKLPEESIRAAFMTPPEDGSDMDIEGMWRLERSGFGYSKMLEYSLPTQVIRTRPVLTTVPV